jgi:hypothetical protein
MPLLRKDGGTGTDDDIVMCSQKKYNAKRLLFRHLKKEHAFWSFDPATVTLSRMDDNYLIEKVLYHLDWDDIMILFEIFPKTQIKKVWKDNLCPLGDYFDKMNILYAAVLFDIKNPRRYIKTQSNRFIKNKINDGLRIIAANGINI